MYKGLQINFTKEKVGTTFISYSRFGTHEHNDIIKTV